MNYIELINQVGEYKKKIEKESLEDDIKDKEWHILHSIECELWKMIRLHKLERKIQW